MTDVEYVAFLQWALPRMGLRWKGFRGVRRQVCKRIARRVSELGLSDLAAYRALLEEREDEWRVLDSLCVVTISRFYRDAGVFDRLRRELVPPLAREAVSAGERVLRAWSLGCASGEEAYTLSMLWHLEVSSQFPSLGLRIVGTDIDDDVLGRAQRGCYEHNSLRELPAKWQELGLEREGALYCVRSTMREGVEFRKEDVRERMPQGPLHLVLCRYMVFTYFDDATQRALAQRIAERTAPFGLLVVGTHEQVPPDTGWTPCASGTHAYRRTG